MNGNWQTLEQQLSKKLESPIQFTHKKALSGGCINQAWKVTDHQKNHWFIKTNAPHLQHMFIAEAEGLAEIQQSQSIRSPKTFAYGSTADFSYLILEYIPLQSHINAQATGEQLAQMHQHIQTDQPFGWKSDNTIGSTPQSNHYHKNWIDFWKQERLLYQLKLAQQKGYSHSAYDAGLKLVDNLDKLFNGYQVVPSLLHGDLWAGNCASDAQSNPVIFDPAVYYGDREADLAMTELFGGFSADFYDSYQASYPLDPGYNTRKILYNLYHILNHYHIFGGSYASQAESMTLKLLSNL